MRRTSFPKLTLVLSIFVGCSSSDATDDGSNDTTVPSTGGPFDDASSESGNVTSAAGDDSSEPAGTSTGSKDDADDDTTTTADADTDTDTDETDETGEAMTGEQQYLTLCATCHGMTGEGSELGYDVQHPVRDYSTWVVRNGRPGEEFEDSAMAAFDTSLLSDELLEEIWDYLDSFPQPTTGEGLYLDYCRNCHGADAKGGVVEVDISNEGHGSILDTVRAGKHAGEFESRNEYMPAFDSTQLTDEEVELIADHIASL